MILARLTGASRMRNCCVATLAKGLPLPAIRALHCHIQDALKSCKLLSQDTRWNLWTTPDIG